MEKNHETVQAFLEAWKKENHIEMFSLCQMTWREGKNPEDLETLFAGKKLKDFVLISSSTLNSVCRKFFYELLLGDGKAARSLINVICEDKPYHTATFGSWGVNPVSVVNFTEFLDKPEFIEVKKPARKATAKKTPEVKKARGKK